MAQIELQKSHSAACLMMKSHRHRLKVASQLVIQDVWIVPEAYAQRLLRFHLVQQTPENESNLEALRSPGMMEQQFESMLAAVVMMTADSERAVNASVVVPAFAQPGLR